MKTAEQACVSLLSKCKSLKPLKQIHAHAVIHGLHSNPFVAGKLLIHCAVHLSDAINYAHRLLIHTSNPDVFMYNALIRGFSESDAPQTSLSTFNLMLRTSDLFPDSFSFAFALKAAANMHCFRTGSQLHCQAVVRGLHNHLYVGTTLISMYAECGSVWFSHKAFEEIPEPNVVTWNAIATAYFRCDDVRGAERVFNLMPLKNLASYNLMLAGYTKMGELEAAGKVFDEMPTRDEVSWSTLVVGFVHNGCFDKAFVLFKELLQLGIRPNEVSLTGVLSGCAQIGALEFAKILHGYIEKAGLLWIVSVNNCLTDMYSKCGDVEMARRVFERMEGKKSIVSWTLMISALAMQGYGEDAIGLFHKMEESGIRPDRISFVSILYACSHAGLVEQGREIFEKMSRVYGVEPEIEHYGCMVDLYGRAGQLQKAYDFVVNMPIPVNDIIWRTLLGACSFFGDVKLAEKVKERLVELDPNNSGDHVLLSNIYAVAGKWKDAAMMRRSMVEKKNPGWSMIEVDKVMYSFVAGAKHDDDITYEARDKLSEIMSRLRIEGGYVPEVGGILHDVEEEEKEDSVTTHSEKLAVAFGMARLCKGSALRILKNLRVCKDCHAFMKSISKLYRMEIVLRDRSRFHSFKDGICSCRDYW